MNRILACVLGCLLLPLPALALAIDVDVSPADPWVSTPVEIRPGIQMGDPGYEVVGTAWSRLGNVLTIDWYMKDLHYWNPGLVWPQIPWTFHGLAEVGLLPAGDYDVNVTLYMSYYPPLFGGPIDYLQFETAQTSFHVAPEPGCIVATLAATCMFAGRRRIRRVL